MYAKLSILMVDTIPLFISVFLSAFNLPPLMSLLFFDATEKNSVHLYVYVPSYCTHF